MLQLQSDSHFIIGHSHKVCDDYTFHGNLPTCNGMERPFAILSDGCSSVPLASTGSRLQVHAAHQLLTTHSLELESGRMTADDFGRLLVNSLMNTARSMQLPFECVASTLWMAWATSEQWDDADEGGGRHVRVLGWGDGHIRWRVTADDEPYWASINYKSNAPAYPLNRYHPGLIDDLGALDCIYDRSWMPTWKAESLKPRRFVFEENLLLRNGGYLLMASDGADSFANKVGGASRLFPSTVMKEFVGGPETTWNGEFVGRRFNIFRRRMKMADDGTGNERNWQHHDDFSVAGICAL